MYGMVHLGLEEMVVDRHDDATWQRITRRAGVPELDSVGNEPYPDELTYALVAATSAELGVEPAALLTDFGRYWVGEFAADHYRTLLDAAGADLPAFLRNLNNLHVRVSLIVPGYRPPRFEVADEQPRALMVHYFSEREGLTPFVTGLLAGAGDRFGLDVEVAHVAGPPQLDHGVFALSW